MTLETNGWQQGPAPIREEGSRALPSRTRSPIAIVGVGAAFPGSHGPIGFWNDIVNGVDRVTDVPATHWLIDDYYDPDPKAPDKTYCKRGAFLAPIPFDPLAFGIPPTAIPATDSAQLLALIVARQVLADASRTRFGKIERGRTSIILGGASATKLVVSMGARLQRPVWARALRESGLPEPQVQDICDRIARAYVPWQESTFPGLLGNVVAGRIANRLDLGGTNAVTDAACASSFSALSMGVNELELGQCDLVITGGVDAANDILMYMCFSKTPALSPTGDCRPFSDSADGTILGEGLGMFALRRLADAERDGNHIYALIRGVGTSSDGQATSVYAPRPEGQASALRRAYAEAGYSPRTVELMEAHGTATKAGDLAEFTALNAVFGTESGDKQWCALGSIKSQIGHTKAAAGAAGLFKAVMALHHKMLPPTIKVERPAPNLPLSDSPFFLNTQARPWIADPDHKRRAAVSSFGFGGSNFHVTLEEYAGDALRAPRYRSFGSELVLLSAQSPTALAQTCAALPHHGGLQATARASQQSFDPSAAVRLAVVADSLDELSARLQSVARHLSDATPLPASCHLCAGPASTGGLAYLFPGQGSQHLQMGADLAMAFDVARAVWDAEATAGAKREPLHRLVFPTPVFDDEKRAAQMEALTATAAAQPAIAATSLSMLALLRDTGLVPDAVAGHSSGEVTALCAAGVFDAETLIAVARRRGELMAAAAGRAGAMAAVSADRDVITNRLAAWSLPLVIANDNSPEQVVLSGPAEAIDQALAHLAHERLTARRLPVASAFHSAIVADSVAPFRRYLAELRFAAPVVPVYANSTAAPYSSAADAMRDLLAGQIAAPVRFRETIDALYDAGIRHFVEVGPGSVLTNLVRQCLKGRDHRSIALDRRGSNGVKALWNGLGELSALGFQIDFGPLWEGFAVDDRTPSEPGKHVIMITGANTGKPYSPPDAAVAQPAPNLTGADRSADMGDVHGVETSGTEIGPIASPRGPSPAEAISSEQCAGAHLEIQRQAAATHAAFQRVMAESHQAYLDVVGRAIQALSGQPAAAPPPDQTRSHVSSSPTPAEMLEGRAETPAVQPMAPPPVETPPVSGASASGAGDQAGISASADVGAILKAVVAEKTGYPAEMLEPGMELEADLGVDSIKQVEILSALRDRLPGIPEIEPAQLTELRTLRQIQTFLSAPAESGANASEETPLPSPPPQGGRERAESVAPSHLTATLGNQRAHCAFTGDTSSLVEETIDRRTVHAVPCRARPEGVRRIHGAERVEIIAETDAIARDMVAAFAERGLQADVVDQAGADADAVIYLGGLGDSLDIDATVAAHRDGLIAARTVAARFARMGGTFVTVQDTGGCFGLDGASERAWLGGLPGLVKTAALEWPKAEVKAIDIERRDRAGPVIARALVEEILDGGREIEVGLKADGQRLTLETRLTPALEVHPPPIDGSSVLVVSGGARGITAAALLELLRRFRPRCAVLGRSDPADNPPDLQDALDEAALRRALAGRARHAGQALTPAEIAASASAILCGRETGKNLDELMRTGAEVRYLRVDIRDRQAVAAALADIRVEWGSITGIVHGAGMLADKLIADKSVGQFDSVFRTKVAGLASLLAACESDPLRLICLFSSVAARRGNAGQCDYAMANEVLNKVAHAEVRRRNGTCVVKAINWGPWDGGMVTPALRRHFEGKGVPLISRDAGTQFFVREVTTATSEVEVLATRLPLARDTHARSVPADIPASA